MNNETIVRMYPRPDPKNMECALDLARADEREKMTQEKFAEYFNTLQGGEVASAILTQLLRRGVTDDDLRGLRLQWIKEQPEGVEVWVSRDDYENSSAIFSSHKPHEEVLGGVLYYNSGLYGFEDALGLQQGECAKFRIVRINDRRLNTMD